MKIRSALPYTVLSILILGAVGIISPTFAQHFTNCLTTQDTGSDATVLIESTVETLFPNEASLEEGDEIALYTSEGTCAGSVAWTTSKENSMLAAVGPDANDTGAGVSGYESGEALKFKIWDASENEEYDLGSAAEYQPCDDSASLCRDDGDYESQVIFTVTQLGNSDTLPVELAEFEAIRDDGRVRLEWTTASETNNLGFDVQHRTSKAEWSSLEFVEGAGTTPDSQHYSHLVTDLEAGRHHFRLRQTDVDGTTTLSDPVTVELTLEEAYELSRITPHPVRGQGRMVLRVRETQTVSAVLYNTLGQRVRTLHQGRLSANETHVLRVDGGKLSSGRYFLRVEGKTFSTNRKLTLMR